LQWKAFFNGKLLFVVFKKRPTEALVKTYKRVWNEKAWSGKLEWLLKLF